MDTLLGFLLDNTGFVLGLAAGLVLGAVLMIAVLRLFAFTERTLHIAEANTLDTPRYGPPDAPRSRVPPRNPMITGELRDWIKDAPPASAPPMPLRSTDNGDCVFYQTSGHAQPLHDPERRYHIVDTEGR